MTANLLERAAHCPNRDIAVSAILLVLQIEDTEIAAANLPDPEEWRSMPYCQRLMQLNSWFTSECFAAIERHAERTEPVTVTARRIRDAARAPLRIVKSDCQGERVRPWTQN